MLPKSIQLKVQKSLEILETWQYHFLDSFDDASVSQDSVFPANTLAAKLPWASILVPASEEDWDAFEQAFHCIFLKNQTNTEVSSSSHQHTDAMAVYKPVTSFGIEIPSSLSALCFLAMWVHHTRTMRTHQDDARLRAEHQGQCVRLKNSLQDVFLHASVPEEHDAIMLAAFEAVGMWNGEAFCVEQAGVEALNSHALVQRVADSKDGCFYKKQDACPGQYLRVMLWSYLVLNKCGAVVGRIKMESLLRGIAFGLRDFATSSQCNVSFGFTQQAIYSRVMRHAFDAKMNGDFKLKAIKGQIRRGLVDGIKPFLCDELMAHYQLITSIPAACVEEGDRFRLDCGRQCADVLGATTLSDGVNAFSVYRPPSVDIVAAVSDAGPSSVTASTLLYQSPSPSSHQDALNQWSPPASSNEFELAQAPSATHLASGTCWVPRSAPMAGILQSLPDARDDALADAPSASASNHLIAQAVSAEADHLSQAQLPAVSDHSALLVVDAKSGSSSRAQSPAVSEHSALHAVGFQAEGFDHDDSDDETAAMPNALAYHVIWLTAWSDEVDMDGQQTQASIKLEGVDTGLRPYEFGTMKPYEHQAAHAMDAQSSDATLVSSLADEAAASSSSAMDPLAASSATRTSSSSDGALVSSLVGDSHSAFGDGSEVEVEVDSSSDELEASDAECPAAPEFAVDALLALRSNPTRQAQAAGGLDVAVYAQTDDVEDAQVVLAGPSSQEQESHMQVHSDAVARSEAQAVAQTMSVEPEASSSQEQKSHMQAHSDAVARSEAYPVAPQVEPEASSSQKSHSQVQDDSEMYVASNAQEADTSASVTAIENIDQWLARYKQVKGKEKGLSAKRYDVIKGVHAECRVLWSYMDQHSYACSALDIDMRIAFYESCINVSNQFEFHMLKIGESSVRQKGIDKSAVRLEQAGFRKSYCLSLVSLHEENHDDTKSAAMQRKADAEEVFIQQARQPEGISRKRPTKHQEEGRHSAKERPLDSVAAKKPRSSSRGSSQTAAHAAALSMADRGMVSDHSLFVGSRSISVFKPLLRAKGSIVTIQGVQLDDEVVPFDSSEAFFDRHHASINTTLDPALGVTPLIAGLMLYDKVAAALKDRYASWLHSMLARTNTQTLNQTIQKEYSDVYRVGDQALSWAYFVGCWPLVHAMLARQDIDLTSPRDPVASLPTNLFEKEKRWTKREEELNRLFAACQTPKALENQLRCLHFNDFIGKSAASYSLAVQIGLMLYTHPETTNSTRLDIRNYLIQALKDGKVTLPNICKKGFSSVLVDALREGMQALYLDWLAHVDLAPALVRVVHMEDYVAGHQVLEAYHQQLIDQHRPSAALAI